MGGGGGAAGTRRGRGRHAAGTRRRVEAVAVDGEATLEAPARFAPGAETCDIVYEFRRGPTLQGATVTLEIKDRANRRVHYSNVIGLGADRRDTFRWDGRDDGGQMISPINSPFTLTFKVGTVITRTRQVAVEVREVSIWTRTTNRRIDMSNPAQKLETIATVTIRRTNGTSAPAYMALTVKYAFIAGGSNMTRNDSYEYRAAGHLRLGKRDDANAVFWEAHTRSTAATDDAWKQTCRVTTVTTGADRGKAFIWFKPSGAGGDTFRIKATVYAADGTTVLREEIGSELTVWRKIHFSRIYTMSGETYIDNATTEAEIDPAYETDAFVMYSRSAVNTLAAALRVKYIGLYQNTAPAKVWPADYSPARLETSPNDLQPTADELAKYAYAGADAARVAQRNNAKTAIEAKATRWASAIVSAYGRCCDDWFADAGVPSDQNVILAVQYYHPKLSGQADGATNFWPAGIQINMENPGSGLTTMGDPDRATWRTVQGFNRGQISVIFKNYGTAARLQIVCRHEIGHGTKSAFKRDNFGTGDHSASALMTPYGGANTFSNTDIGLLRGRHR